MVLHTQASYGLAHVITAKYWHDLKATDLQWTLSDTGWDKAAYGKLFGQWTQEAAVIQHDARGRFDPVLTMKIMERYGVTSFCAPPTAYRMMVLEDLTKYDFGELRHCTGAGEPLNPEVMKIWEDGTGLTIYDGYGRTETVLLVENFRCLPVRPGSIGKPAPGFNVAIVDEDGEELPTAKKVRSPLGSSPRGRWACSASIGSIRKAWKHRSMETGTSPEIRHIKMKTATSGSWAEPTT